MQQVKHIFPISPAADVYLESDTIDNVLLVSVDGYRQGVGKQITGKHERSKGGSDRRFPGDAGNPGNASGVRGSYLWRTISGEGLQTMKLD